jgi:mRNA-degrading endonuclease RelE of RelBE toxin-antitoxin system
MPKIKLSRRFLNAYADLPMEIRVKVDKALRLLQANLRHPSLQTKPIKGAHGFYEARVDINYRMTYFRLPDDTVEMSNVDSHDDVLKNP